MLFQKNETKLLFALEKLNADHPRRPVDWRWQLANKLFSLQNSDLVNLYKPQNDIWFDKAYIFYASLPENNRNVQDKLVNFINSTTREDRLAYMIYMDEDDNLLKHALEAYLLTDLEYAFISAKLNIPLSTIEFYEKIFFNVKDRLHNIVWIVDQVFGTSLVVGVPFERYQILWKFYGYFGGVNILDKVISLAPERCETLTEFVKSELQQLMFFKAAIMARNMRADEESMKTLFSSITKILEIETKTVQTQSFEQLDSDLVKFKQDLTELLTFAKNKAITVVTPLQKDNEQISNKEECTLLNLPSLVDEVTQTNN
jgi:hypothetical protein